MNYEEFSTLFARLCRQNGVLSLTKEQIDLFWSFTDHLLTVNQTTNLTAIRNLPDVIDKHLVDSLLVSAQIPHGARVLDLGCGPGFPSIPLAIARPDLSIVALDSTAKKIAFVTTAAEKIGISNLQAISGRAEDRALAQQLGTFDIVVSRAVARLNVLCELCLPYLSVDGVLLAMKGAKAQEELAEAKRAIQILGGGVPTASEQPLILSNHTEEARATVRIPKTKPTPPLYPRVYATILKKPL